MPFVEDEETVYLKTVIASRNVTKQYLGEEFDDDGDEKELLDSVERGEWRRARYSRYAKAAIRKDRRLNIRPPRGLAAFVADYQDHSSEVSSGSARQ